MLFCGNGLRFGGHGCVAVAVSVSVGIGIGMNTSGTATIVIHAGERCLGSARCVFVRDVFPLVVLF